MIRTLLLIVILFALAAGFVWLADHPGSVTFDVAGYAISTSLMAAAIIILGVILLGIILWLLVRAILRAPRALTRQTQDRRRELGYKAVAKGLVAVGSGDTTLAVHYAAESRHYARNEPMTLMLSAEAAQLSGDTMSARAAYEAMLAKAETKLLGLRGLFGEARRRNDPTAARSFAEEAVREKPGIPWAASALLEYQAADGEWAAALETLETLTAAGTIDATRGRRLKAVLLTARADQIETGEPEAARDLALEAHRIVPELVPAAVLAARLASRLGDSRRAGKVIETSWKIEPHPELALAYMSIRPGESGRDRLKRIRQLTKIRANHLEGQLAIARAAIEAKEWATAREELRSVIAAHPSERAFIMMAEIEEGEHRDIGRARDWLSRAVRAPRDPAWMADGYAFDHWEPVSPVSGRIDAFEWKAPVERMGGEQPQPATLGLPPDDRTSSRPPMPPPVATPAMEVFPAATPPPGRAIVPVPGRALFPVPHGTPPVVTHDVPVDDDSDIPTPPAKDIFDEGPDGFDPDERAPATRPPAKPGKSSHQPDDPGPDPNAPPPPQPKPRRFRLFS